MKISELFEKINILSTNEKDAIRLLQAIVKNKRSLHIPDLDFALILLAFDAQSLIEKDDIKALADSRYAKYLVPELFYDDTELVDKEKFINEVETAIAQKIPHIALPQKSKEAIFDYDLSTEIVLDSLLVNKESEIAISNNVQIQARCSEFYSYALLQTKYSIIDEVILTNIGNEAIKGLKLKISSNSDYIGFADIDIAVLNPKEPVSISNFNITYNMEKFLSLVEKVSDSIVFSIVCNDEVVAKLTTPVEYFSYDTWFGNVLPETISLFVTPNDESVKNVVRLTAKTLQKQTSSPSLCDYQANDKDNVIAQLKALYDTLHDLGIGYITAPASFEQIGQKVRLPHIVITGKQGTCIDLSVLFASCAEAMGLNAFIVLVHGHAYVGAFLANTHFQLPRMDDAGKVLTMNSEAENDLVLIESTAFTAGNDTTFEQACSIGRLTTQKHITDDNFQAIDIGLCRCFGYLPLPIAFDDVEKRVVDYDVVAQNKIKLAQKEYSVSNEQIALNDANIGRFDLWEKKLLDLSKRNQLIDFKLRGKGLQIFSYDMNAIYQSFESKGKSYSIVESDVDLSNYQLLELPPVTEDRYNMISSMFEKGVLPMIKRQSSLNASLKYFERERRVAFEESGSNVLYIAVGFIEWFESDKSHNPKFAPIVLVPVDIKRHSKESYSISGREELPFLNISIFEFFHQEFKMNFDDLLSMPLFDGEVNIDAILNTVAEKIKKIKRATVIRTAALNVFDFSKAVMWSDMRYRKTDLLKNRVVKSIIDGHYTLNDDEKLLDRFDDDSSDPRDLAIPLSADSSQIQAIKDCADGKSFILQGPPGTGKSQTITNMIVNTIYHGKTVLFVAEKMAALEVVQKRLEKLGLGMFALEAHSIKSDKANIMQQFERRISLGVTNGVSTEFNKVADELKQDTSEVNRVVNLLHKKNNYFMSFYDAFVRYLDMDNDLETIDLSDEYLFGLNERDFDKTIEILSRLADSLYQVGGIKNNPFVIYGNTNYIPGVSKNELLKEIDKFIPVLSSFLDVYKEFCSTNELDYNCDLQYVDAVCSLIKTKEINEIVVSLIGTTLVRDKVFNEMIKKGCDYQKRILSIKKEYNDGIWSYDFQSNEKSYQAACSYKGLKKRIKAHKLVSELKKYSLHPKTVKEEQLIGILSQLKAIKALQDALLTTGEKYKIVFNEAEFGALSKESILTIDFEMIKRRIENTGKVQSQYECVIPVSELRKIIGKMQGFLLLSVDGLISNYENITAFNDIFNEKFKFDRSLSRETSVTYEKLIRMMSDCRSNIDVLPSWCAVLSNIEKCKKSSLEFILDYVKKMDQTLLLKLEEIYRKSVYKAILHKAIAGDEHGSFNSSVMKQEIDSYKKQLAKFSSLSIQETAARVSSKMPLINDKSPASSEQGILNKAVKNKCRGKSIRKLFEETQHIITRLFPVFLMSPISCAQYLSPDMPKFDVVIFDEASQMPTSEAVGAIARGNSLVVVGDSKQMPPTAFFKGKGTDDEYADLSDQESILDDCDVIGMPSRSLLWHYRSKHESLIRFSNAKFYNNNLTTFPSPNDMISKVSLKKIDGIYGEKKATNEKEAKAIITEIAQRLKSPELRKRSIGVVTFSSVQQELIEDMLQDFFADHKDLELINAQSAEPIIIKNLENIQGDERDVILFSICYGPDKNGKMYYRFGPINNAGGEKRLNVAVSRARYEMIVYASFDPERLSSMKTDSRGAQELYSFLRYAKYGTESLSIDNSDARERKEGIEKQIAEDLRMRGYNVKTDVGKSSFRVDIGVVDPENKNRYVLGIVCDSYSYENANTARDRNVVQPSVLNALGWNLLRVWSFDYYDDSKRVIDQIVTKIEELKHNPNVAARDNEEDLSIELHSHDVEYVNYAKEYTCYDKVYYIDNLDFDYASIKMYSQIIKEILDVESPIAENVLYNRFANAMGFSRAGSNIQQVAYSALKSIGAKKNNNNGKTKVFFWRNNQDLKLQNYRVGGSKPRDFEDIPKEEVFVAIREVLINHGAIFVSELKSCVAECFGIKAVRNKVSETIDDTIEFYKKKGELVSCDNDSKIALKGAL